MCQRAVYHRSHCQSVITLLLVHEQRFGAALAGIRAGGLRRHDCDIQTGAQRLDVPAHHAEAVAGIGGVFEPSMVKLYRTGTWCSPR